MSDENPPLKKDRRAIAEFIILGALSPAVAVTVWWITPRSEGAKIQLEYVRIATAILQQLATDEQRPIREWAVALLNNSAPIKLIPAHAGDFVSGTVTLPYSNYDSYRSSDWYEITPNKRRPGAFATPTPSPK